MNPCSPNEVRSELARIGVVPQRRLGQNFLIDRNILDIIIAAAELGPSDRVLEVGPGLGVLTRPLAESCAKVTCVEKDFKLADYMRESFAGVENVELVGSDTMRVDFSRMDVNKCVSNLPYSIGSRFLVDFTAAAKAALIVVMVQDEVADKMSVRPGCREFGLMSMMMQVDYEVETVKTVKASCFWPRPEVDSKVVRLRLRSQPLLQGVEKIFLRKFAKGVFSQRRKKIGIMMRKRAGHDYEAAEAVGFLEQKRPEELSMEGWCHIARNLCGR